MAHETGDGPINSVQSDHVRNRNRSILDGLASNIDILSDFVIIESSRHVHCNDDDEDCGGINADGLDYVSYRPQRMSFCRKLCYSVGHILSDVTGTIAVSYLLVYFHTILGFDAVLAGYLILMGQIVDGVCTPLVGYESDRSTGFGKLGRRKSWYLVGVLCVAFSFPFIFNPVIDGAQHSSSALAVYYVPFVVILQFGWASTEISHLSLIPDLTRNSDERVELNSLRYGFKVLANIVVFGMAWLLLSRVSVNQTTSSRKDYDTLQPSDEYNFRILVFAAMALGVFFVIIFFAVTKEKFQQQDMSSLGKTVYDHPKLVMKWTCWLKEPQFYQVAVLYMCARIYMILTCIYLPLYIINTLDLNKTYIASVPMTVYASGFASSLLVKKVHMHLGSKLTYLIGLLIAAGACTYIFHLQPDSDQIYIVACMIGLGGCTMGITALAFTGELISDNTETAAFVYGAMTLSDKISNGVAILIIQRLQPQVGVGEFFRYTMTFVPVGALVVASLMLMTLCRSTIGHHRAYRKNNKERLLESSDELPN